LGVQRDFRSYDSTDESASFAKLFLVTAGATLLIKLLLAAFFPMTGDEAYFIIWGKHLDYGYYDHPGMTGWWLWLMLQISDAAWVVRLPAVLAPFAVAFMIRSVLRETLPDRADLVAALFLVSPTNLLNFFTTTDTPVFLFGFMAAVKVWQGFRRDEVIDTFWAGLLLGAAFFAKYFAVPLGVALGVFVLLNHGRRRFVHFAALAAGVIPWAALNILWLYHNGWTNILFNFFNRNRSAEFNPAGPLIVLAFLVVYLGPAVAWFLLKPRAAGRVSLAATWARLRETGLHTFAVGAGIPIAIFLAVSLAKPVGLHWLLTFAPMLFVALAPRFEPALFRRMYRPTLAFSLIPIVLVSVLLAIPPQTGRLVLEKFGRGDDYESVILGVYPEKVLPVLEPYMAEYTLMSASYAKAAVLGYHARQYVPVFGEGSYHARQDDFLTDFRRFDGGNIMVVTHKDRDVEACRPFFDEVEVKPINVEDAHLLLILCRGFHFERYRDQVLRKIARQYYTYPDWMRSFARPGPFVRRYGLEEETDGSRAMPTN